MHAHDSMIDMWYRVVLIGMPHLDRMMMRRLYTNILLLKNDKRRIIILILVREDPCELMSMLYEGNACLHPVASNLDYHRSSELCFQSYMVRSNET